ALAAPSAWAVTSSTRLAVPSADEGDLPAGPWDGWTSDRDDDGDPAGDLPRRRAQPRDWAEPPAWGGTAGAGAGAAGAGAAGAGAAGAAAAAGAGGAAGRGADTPGASGRDATPPPFLAEPGASRRDTAAPAGRSASGSGGAGALAGAAAGGVAAAGGAGATGEAVSRAATQPPPEPEWDGLD